MEVASPSSCPPDKQRTDGPQPLLKSVLFPRPLYRVGLQGVAANVNGRSCRRDGTPEAGSSTSSVPSATATPATPATPGS